MLNKTVDLGTDVATLFVFYPEELSHRQDAPIDWYMYSFACGKEFAAGRLIAFQTGSDGGYRLRLTDGDLTEAEKSASNGSWEFGFVVREGRVFVDNSNCLPSADQADEADKLPDQWVEIPNGAYKVTVHAIATPEGQDSKGELADYVLVWEPTTESPEKLVHSPTPPLLELYRGAEPSASEGVSAEGYMPAEDDEPLQERYLLLEGADRFVVPGYSESFPVSDAILKAIWGDSFSHDNDDAPAEPEEEPLEEIEEVVVAPSGDTPTLATLARVYGASQMAGEPGKVEVGGKRLVQVVARLKGPRGLSFVRVEQVQREETPLSESEVESLKEAFAAYTDNNPEYVKRVKNAEFEKERISAMTSGPHLTAKLLNLLEMPANQRAELLVASDKERLPRLLALLRDSAS